MNVKILIVETQEEMDPHIVKNVQIILIIKYKKMGTEETKILPTVGRMVYYKSYGTPNGEYKPEDRAAVITAVVNAEEEIIDLCVFNPTGLFFNRNVKKAVEGESKCGKWDWMPFQKDQQLKAGYNISGGASMLQSTPAYKAVEKDEEETD